MKRHTHPPEHMKQFDEPYYEIVEWYPENDGTGSWTVEGMCPSGTSPEECQHDYELMAGAFMLPVLDEEELEREIEERKAKNEESHQRVV
jgi:hypothetical protein